LKSLASETINVLLLHPQRKKNVITVAFLFWRMWYIVSTRVAGKI